MSFNLKIREARKNKGLTQEELADVLHVSLMSIRRYESGMRIPPADVLGRIAKTLDVDVDNLLWETSEEDKLMNKFTMLLVRAGFECHAEGDDKIWLKHPDFEKPFLIAVPDLMSRMEGILSDAEIRKEQYIISKLLLEFVSSNF